MALQFGKGIKIAAGDVPPVLDSRPSMCHITAQTTDCTNGGFTYLMWYKHQGITARPLTTCSNVDSTGIRFLKATVRSSKYSNPC